MGRLGLDRRTLRATALAALTLLGFVAIASAAPNEKIDPFPLAPGTQATALTAGPEGKIWFVGRAEGAPARAVGGYFAPDGGGRQKPLSEGSDERTGELAAGPDGNVWFTDPGGNSIVRMTPAGELLGEYALPSAGASPGAIVAGPGAAMWFVEEAADKVGRIEMSGAIAEFALAPGARPTGIAEGSDGAIWIVERGLRKIARMTPNGSVSAEYALPDPESRPQAIIRGPGGDLWFSDESGPRIGRITAAGQIDELPIPGDNGTRELALGADGNLWFTTGYAIGSVAASGTAGEPECIDSACRVPVNAIAKGPEGELWFATANGLVGKYYAPPLRVRIGRRATKVDDGLTTVAISCHGGTASQACRGWLRLTAEVPRGKGRGGRTKVLLDQHRYKLLPATSRRLPLALGSRGRRALARGKRLTVRVSGTLDDGTGASRAFVLQARRRG